MAISADERFIIEQILKMGEDGSTHELPDVLDNPIGNYNDPDKHAKEMEVLFKNFPIAVAHASEIANPGEFFTFDDTGVPIIVTRDRDQQVRAYLNVCRHRGARLANEPCGKTSSFTCPYHSWSYGLDGQLRGMPQPKGFKDLDKSTMGLVEVPVFERFGLIWLVPSVQGEPIDIDAWLAPMAEQFNSVDMDSQYLFKKWKLNRDMSWRIALEGFQECYHFCHAHRTTACSNYLDNQSYFLNAYPHFRHAVPLPRVLDLKDADPSDWEYRSNFMTQNYIFPANFVQVMTDHIYIHTIIPTAEGKCIFQCMMLLKEKPRTDKAERYFEKNYEVVRTVFNEDFVIGEGIQNGLDTGVNQHFTFGTYEIGLHYGQKAIDDALAGELTVPRR